MRLNHRNSADALDAIERIKDALAALRTAIENEDDVDLGTVYENLDEIDGGEIDLRAVYESIEQHGVDNTPDEDEDPDL